MHVKIQGGGSGNYSNTGTSYGVVTYLRHEDKKLLENDRAIESFFSNDCDNVRPTEVVSQLDANKAKLGRDDAKFFVLTISPSKEEVLAMGENSLEQSKNFKEYINNEVMKHYAAGFGKNLEAGDILYFGKIHHARGDKTDEQMHAHIIVSRKDKSNKIKLSPQTNHRNTKKGAIKGGFDRTDFFKSTESSFDKFFKYERSIEDTFDYKNSMKNGSILEKVNTEIKHHQDYLKRSSEILKPTKDLSLDLPIPSVEKLATKVVKEIVKKPFRDLGMGM